MAVAVVTGSAGLIGSEAVRLFCEKGFDVVGIDNNFRQRFFGEEASTTWNRKRLEASFKTYRHYDADIRDHVPLPLVTRERRHIDTCSDYWQAVLDSTGQPRFAEEPSHS